MANLNSRQRRRNRVLEEQNKQEQQAETVAPKKSFKERAQGWLNKAKEGVMNSGLANGVREIRDDFKEFGQDVKALGGAMREMAQENAHKLEARARATNIKRIHRSNVVSRAANINKIRETRKKEEEKQRKAQAAEKAKNKEIAVKRLAHIKMIKGKNAINKYFTQGKNMAQGLLNSAKEMVQENAHKLEVRARATNIKRIHRNEEIKRKIRIEKIAAARKKINRRNAINRRKQAIKDGFNNGANWLKSLPGKALNAAGRGLKSIGSKAWNFVKNSKLGKKVGSIYNTTKEFGGKVVNGVTKSLKTTGKVITSTAKIMKNTAIVMALPAAYTVARMTGTTNKLTEALTKKDNKNINKAAKQNVHSNEVTENAALGTETQTQKQTKEAVEQVQDKGSTKTEEQLAAETSSPTEVKPKDDKSKTTEEIKQESLMSQGKSADAAREQVETQKTDWMAKSGAANNPKFQARLDAYKLATRANKGNEDLEFELALGLERCMTAPKEKGGLGLDPKTPEGKETIMGLKKQMAKEHGISSFKETKTKSNNNSNSNSNQNVAQVAAQKKLMDDKTH